MKNKLIAIIITLVLATNLCSCTKEQVPKIDETIPIETQNNTSHTIGDSTLNNSLKNDNANQTSDISINNISGDVKEEKEIVETTENTEPTKTPQNNVVVQSSTDTGISNHNHTFSKKVVAATCCECGYTEYSCSCGYSYKDDETLCDGHTIGDTIVTVASTYEEEGAGYVICSVCKEKITDVVIPKKYLTKIDEPLEVVLCSTREDGRINVGMYIECDFYGGEDPTNEQWDKVRSAFMEYTGMDEQQMYEQCSKINRYISAIGYSELIDGSRTKCIYILLDGC